MISLIYVSILPDPGVRDILRQGAKHVIHRGNLYVHLTYETYTDNSRCEDEFL